MCTILNGSFIVSSDTILISEELADKVLLMFLCPFSLFELHFCTNVHNCDRVVLLKKMDKSISVTFLAKIPLFGYFYYNQTFTFLLGLYLNCLNIRLIFLIMIVTVVIDIEYILISAFDMISQTDKVKSYANKPRMFILLTLYGHFSNKRFCCLHSSLLNQTLNWNKQCWPTYTQLSI